MKILNFLMSIIGFGSTTETPRVPMKMVSVPVTLSLATPIPEEPVSIPVRQLTCVLVSGSKKKVRFITRRGHWMTAEIAGRNGGGEVFLRRPGHRFSQTFRRVLTA